MMMTEDDEQVPGTSAQPPFSTTRDHDGTSVRVALRIRPQIPREKLDGSRVCTRVPTPKEPQVLLGSDRAFTFDHVFDLPEEQSSVYEGCVVNLVEGTFEGYNATIFAYGQTGSGKTYTMGTGFDLTLSDEEKGIVPRAVEHLFAGIQRRREAAVEEGRAQPEFRVQVQFTELYNEEIIDLLDPNVEDSGVKKTHIRIHEDSQGNIYTDGATSLFVNSAQETLGALKNGALSRTTASTNMNLTSSRSHAIFTIQIRQQRVSKFEKCSRAADSSPDSGMEGSGDAELPEFESLTAKFHFVDLAGSERLKRTGATGDRAKEGISINCGLLALGNVISALGDTTKKALHVPYRDSKLTRLLQDSLGGNSRTLMIACISPSDCDFVETLNTLKYANRAKNIKNKVVVNQDKTSRIIADLRSEMHKLQIELMEYKQGKRLVSADGSETVNDMFHENVMLQTEVNNLRVRIKALQDTTDDLKRRNAQLLSEREIHKISLPQSAGGDNGLEDVIGSAIRKYLEEIEELRASIFEKDAEAQVLRRQLGRMKTDASANLLSPLASKTFGAELTLPSEFHMTSSLGDLSMLRSATSDMTLTDETINGSILEEAKADIERLKSKTAAADRKGKTKEKAKEEAGATSDYATDQNDQEEGRVNGGEGMFGLSESESSSDMNDGESGGEDAEDESETEEEEQESEKFGRDLANLQNEISIRERLVEELERSQRNMAMMQKQYDTKIRDLQNRIAATETERDRILSEMEAKSVEKEEKERVQKMRQEYEVKLTSMKSQLRQFNNIQKEHQRTTRDNESTKRSLQKYQEELRELKKLKVQLMTRIKEESKRAQISEQKRAKEVSLLQKESRQKDNEIKKLEVKNQKNESFLKRKQEELAQFRKANRVAINQQRNAAASRTASAAATRSRMEQMDSAPVPSRFQRRPVLGTQLRGAAVPSHVAIRRGPFSPRAAKNKWSNIEKTISGLVTKKQMIARMEEDLGRFVARREDLWKQKAALSSKLEENPEREDRGDLREEMESVQANLDYIQESIAELQRGIVDVEDSKDDGDEEQELKKIADVTNLSEAKYLLERLMHLSVSQSFQAAVKDAELKETEARVHQLQRDTQMKANLLHYAMDMNPELFELDAIGPPPAMTSSGESGNSMKAARTPSPDGYGYFQRSNSLKARRRTATTEELLYPLEQAGTGGRAAGAQLETVPETNGGSRTRETSPERLTQLTEGREDLMRKVTVVDTTPLKKEGPHTPPKNPAIAAEVLRRKLETVVEQQQEKRMGAGKDPEESEGEREEKVKWRKREQGDWTENRGSAATSLMPPPQGHLFRRTLSSKENGTQNGLQPSASSSRLLGRGDWRGSLRRPNSSATLVGNQSSSDLRKQGDPLLGESAGFSRNSRFRSTVASTSNLMTKSTGNDSYPLPAACTTALPQGLSASAWGRLGPHTSPPVSPRAQRRQAGDSRNVFARLIPNGASSESNARLKDWKKGVIRVYAPSKSTSTPRENPLICTHVILNACTAGVLSVAVDGNVMVTGAKDRYAKVWDFTKGEEVARLGGHPNNVTCVRIKNNLVFTVSNASVRLWDLRTKACVKTLSSSGLTTDGDVTPNTPSRTNTLPSTESMITSLELGPRGDYFLTAAGTQIRIWDAQRYTCTGKLVKATKVGSSEVSCLAVMESPNGGGDYVMAGSRDHYVKAYRLPKHKSHSSIEAGFYLEPPHYDGITCLTPVPTDAARSDKFWLFSASRDQNIMKWELPGGTRLHQTAKAHGNWITDTKTLPHPFGRVLVSSCRDGLLKLWDVDTCGCLGDFKAHTDAITSLAVSGGLIFSASK